jgi:hypothetical protein
LDGAYVLHADAPTEELSQVAIEGLGGNSRTRPLPSERIAQANEIIADDNLPLNGSLLPLQVEPNAGEKSR